ncbi:MAG: protein translocase subunit SecF [Tissierellales bacterium]|nr:protein translocase subunit SecF [Tissierellales bacterium]MBN2827900.1 protein translocase subunit SecF [Tissierellales bacterium]
MNLNIIKHKNKFFILSASIIIVGLLFIMFFGLNLGIDFTGGTLIQIELHDKIEVVELRELTDTFDSNASIVHAGENKTQVIIKTTLDLDNSQRYEIFQIFSEKYNLAPEDLINQQKFGPSIGQEIQGKAFISVIVASLFMLGYITFRFEFYFGIAAVIALIHDVLIGLAVYAVLKIPVNSSFIAAMLTIVGYSINDTIVVFDRIRENLKNTRKMKYDQIIDLSISQTIVRSINTSVTTLFAITSLYIFGVEAIKDFALPLIIGILAGTYSSIFIASPLWYLLKSRKGDVNMYNPNKATR